MTRNAPGANEATHASQPDNARQLAEIAAGAEDRSPRVEERSDEPGFFEQIVQMLKPRPVATLRESFGEALAKVEPGASGFTASEHKMLTQILALHEVRVEDIMVPRSEIDGIELDASLGTLMLRFEETGRSRMPVYGDGLDDPRGMIHIRDAVRHLTQSALLGREPGECTALEFGRIDLERSIEDLGLMRKVLFVPPSMPAAELMARMQAAHIQMALVIDEYGGTDGLVSLEDTIEKIVGEIEDEHDDDESPIMLQPDGSYLVEGRAELEEIRRIVGRDFDISGHTDASDTIGGLVVHDIGRIPADGEMLRSVEGFCLTVIEADSRRVKRVRIERESLGGTVTNDVDSTNA